MSTLSEQNQRLTPATSVTLALIPLSAILSALSLLHLHRPQFLPKLARKIKATNCQTDTRASQLHSGHKNRGAKSLPTPSCGTLPATRFNGNLHRRSATLPAIRYSTNEGSGLPMSKFKGQIQASSQLTTLLALQDLLVMLCLALFLAHLPNDLQKAPSINHVDPSTIAMLTFCLCSRPVLLCLGTLLALFGPLRSGRSPLCHLLPLFYLAVIFVILAATVITCNQDTSKWRSGRIFLLVLLFAILAINTAAAISILSRLAKHASLFNHDRQLHTKPLETTSHLSCSGWPEFPDHTEDLPACPGAFTAERHSTGCDTFQSTTLNCDEGESTHRLTSIASADKSGSSGFMARQKSCTTAHNASETATSVGKFEWQRQRMPYTPVPGEHQLFVRTPQCDKESMRNPTPKTPLRNTSCGCEDGIHHNTAEAWRVAYRLITGLLCLWCQILLSLPVVIQPLVSFKAANDSTLLLVMAAGLLINAPVLAVQVWLTEEGSHIERNTQHRRRQACFKSSHRQAGPVSSSHSSRSYSLQIYPDRASRSSTPFSIATALPSVGSVPYHFSHWTSGKVSGDRVLESRTTFKRGLSIALSPQPKLDVLPPGGRHWTPLRLDHDTGDAMFYEECPAGGVEPSGLVTCPTSPSLFAYDPDMSTPGQARHTVDSLAAEDSGDKQTLPECLRFSHLFPDGTELGPNARDSASETLTGSPCSQRFGTSRAPISISPSLPPDSTMHNFRFGESLINLPPLNPSDLPRSSHMGRRQDWRREDQDSKDAGEEVELVPLQGRSGEYWCPDGGIRMKALELSIPSECPQFAIEADSDAVIATGAADGKSLLAGLVSQRFWEDVENATGSHIQSHTTSKSTTILRQASPVHQNQRQDGHISFSTDPHVFQNVKIPPGEGHSPPASDFTVRSSSLSLSHRCEGEHHSAASNLLPHNNWVNNRPHRSATQLCDTIEFAQESPPTKELVLADLNQQKSRVVEHDVLSSLPHSSPPVLSWPPSSTEMPPNPSRSCASAGIRDIDDVSSSFMNSWAESIMKEADGYHEPCLELAQHVEPLKVGRPADRSPSNDMLHCASPFGRDDRKSLGSSLGLTQFQEDDSYDYHAPRKECEVGIGLPSSLAPPSIVRSRGSGASTTGAGMMAPSRPVSDSTRRSLGSEFGLAELVREAVERADRVEAEALGGEGDPCHRRVTSDTLAFSDSTLDTELIVSPDGSVELRGTPSTLSSSKQRSSTAYLTSPLHCTSDKVGALQVHVDHLTDDSPIEPFDIRNLNTIAQHFYRWSAGPLPALTEMSEEYASASQSQSHGHLGLGERQRNDWELLNRTLDEIYQRRNRDSVLSEGKASIHSPSLLNSPSVRNHIERRFHNPLSPTSSVHSFGWAEVLQHERGFSLAQLLAIPDAQAKAANSRQRLLSNVSLSAVSPRRALGLHSAFWDHTMSALPSLSTSVAQAHLDQGEGQTNPRCHGSGSPAGSISSAIPVLVHTITESDRSFEMPSPGSPKKHVLNSSRRTSGRPSVSSLFGMAKNGARRLSLVAGTVVKSTVPGKSTRGAIESRYRPPSFSMSQLRTRSTSGVSTVLAASISPSRQLPRKGSQVVTPRRRSYDHVSLAPTSPWLLVNGRPELGDTSQMHQNLANLLSIHDATSLSPHKRISVSAEERYERPESPEEHIDRGSVALDELAEEAINVEDRSIIQGVSAPPRSKDESSSPVSRSSINAGEISFRSKIKYFEKLTSRNSPTRPAVSASHVVHSNIRRRRPSATFASPGRCLQRPPLGVSQVLQIDEDWEEEPSGDAAKGEAESIPNPDPVVSRIRKVHRKLPPIPGPPENHSSTEPCLRIGDTPTRVRELVLSTETAGACMMMDVMLIERDRVSEPRHKDPKGRRPRMGGRLTEAHLLLPERNQHASSMTQDKENIENLCPPLSSGTTADGHSQRDIVAGNWKDKVRGKATRPMPRNQVVTSRFI